MLELPGTVVQCIVWSQTRRSVVVCVFPIAVYVRRLMRLVRRDDDYRRREEEARRSPKYDRDSRRYDDDDYYRRDGGREDREYRRRDRDERDRERDQERRMSGYGRHGEYDKYQAADLERRMENLDIERRERDRQRERDREYDRDREREREREGARPRRGSFYGGGERPSSTYQAAPGGNYPATYTTAPTSTYTAAPGGNYPTSATYRAASPRPLDRPASPYRNPAAPRPVSPYHGAAPIAPRPISPYAVPGAVPRAVSPFQAGAIQRAASPYGAPPPLARAASPFGGGGIPPRAASPYYGSSAAAGTYPPGHVFEGQPMRPASRAPSPSPYGVPGAPVNIYANPGSTYGAPAGQVPYAPPPAPYGTGIGSHASPRVGAIPLDAAGQQQMLPTPEGFSRPPNRAQPYTQFEMIKIGDMDDFLDQVPRMPAVLMPHDVYHEDWIRLMTVSAPHLLP